jgi:hypothetical protein
LFDFDLIFFIHRLDGIFSEANALPSFSDDIFLEINKQ